VRLEIDGDVLELSETSAADQDRLIGLFIARHATWRERNERPAQRSDRRRDTVPGEL